MPREVCGSYSVAVSSWYQCEREIVGWTGIEARCRYVGQDKVCEFSEAFASNLRRSASRANRRNIERLFIRIHKGKIHCTTIFLLSLHHISKSRNINV